MTSMRSRSLIVEDDLRARTCSKILVRSRDVPVHHSCQWGAGSQVCPRESVILVLLDLMLPGEDGLSICKRLRASGAKSLSSCLPP